MLLIDNIKEDKINIKSGDTMYLVEDNDIFGVDITGVYPESNDIRGVIHYNNFDKYEKFYFADIDHNLFKSRNAAKEHISL